MAKRIREARHYQRKDAAIRLLAEHAKPAIRRDFRASLGHLGSLVPTEQVLQFARAGDWFNVKRAINWAHYREVLKAPFGRLAKLRQAGAELGVQKINGSFAQARRRVRFRKGGQDSRWWVTKASSESPGALDELFAKDSIGDRFNFDILDQATQDRIRAAQDELIRELETQARDTIDTIVMNGAREGLAAEDIVGDIRDMIGLTARQGQAVMNYESMLRDLDPGALMRQLRNSEYDAVFQDAIDAGEDMSEVAISKMVDDYIENYLDYRAETIAQTESVRAINSGIQDGEEQARDRGALPSDAIRQFWQIALDEKTCPVCLSIPDMNPDGVEIGEPFDSIDGPMDAPPDPHPSCRCSLEIITDLDKVPDDELGKSYIVKYSEDQPRDEHGRWTASSGGSQNDPFRSLSSAELRTAADKVAKEMGYDSSKISIRDDQQTFILNGQTMVSGGLAYTSGSRLGQIEIFTNLNSDNAAGVIVHEIEHQKYQAFIDAYYRDNAAMQNDPGPAPNPSGQYWWERQGGSAAIMSPDGSLKGVYAEKYPFYTAMHESFNSVDSAVFENGDGVSPYSYEYWRGVRDGTIGRQSAMHETLAEMARLKYETGKFPDHMGPRITSYRGDVKPTQASIKAGESAWRKLYKTIEKMYS